MKKTIVTVAAILLIAMLVVREREHRARLAAMRPTAPQFPSPSPRPDAAHSRNNSGVGLSEDGGTGLKNNPFVHVSDGPSYSSDIVLMLNAHPDVKMTELQRAKAQAVYDSVQRRRLLHEGSIAQFERRDGDEITITIPAYEQEGARLRDVFATQLRESVGDEVAVPFLRAAEIDLLYAMKGFGQRPQVIEARLDRANECYVFEHEIQFVDTLGFAAKKTEVSRLPRGVLDVYAGYAGWLPR